MGKQKTEGLAVGQRYQMGRRVLAVTGLAPMTVEYLDGYGPGVALPRTSSRIQWEVDVRAGELVLVSPKKRGR